MMTDNEESDADEKKKIALSPEPPASEGASEPISEPLTETKASK